MHSIACLAVHYPSAEICGIEGRCVGAGRRCQGFEAPIAEAASIPEETEGNQGPDQSFRTEQGMAQVLPLLYAEYIPLL